MCTVRRNPLASLLARYCASMDIWPDTYSATASGPCSSMMARNRRAGLGDGVVDRCRRRLRRPARGRTSADLSRPSSAAIISAWVAPLVHSRPKLAG